MDERTTFQWLGTAGFRVENGGRVLLIDPFFNRGREARPVQPLRPADMADAEMIFLTHGHFDHLADVPAIVDVSGAAVYCSSVAADTLEGKGVPPEKITRLGGDESLDLGGITLHTFPSRHIKFDSRLILRTAPRVLRHANADLLRQVSGMPSGPVLIYWFDFAGLTVVHTGSLGITPEEAMRQGLKAPDVLMLPLQGHSRICTRAALLTAAINPRAVVPQHFDDFFPPVSQWVELMPFKTMVEKLAPECRYYEPSINEVFTSADVLAGRRESGTGTAE